MADFVGEHTPERTRQLMTAHDPEDRSGAGPPKRQHMLCGIDRDKNWSPARGIRAHDRLAQDCLKSGRATNRRSTIASTEQPPAAASDDGRGSSRDEHGRSETFGLALRSRAMTLTQSNDRSELILAVKPSDSSAWIPAAPHPNVTSRAVIGGPESPTRHSVGRHQHVRAIRTWRLLLLIHTVTFMFLMSPRPLRRLSSGPVWSATGLANTDDAPHRLYGARTGAEYKMKAHETWRPDRSARNSVIPARLRVHAGEPCNDCGFVEPRRERAERGNDGGPSSDRARAVGGSDPLARLTRPDERAGPGSQRGRR